jgi:uncharacterized RDD family membrane protein YckC
MTPRPRSGLWGLYGVSGRAADRRCLARGRCRDDRDLDPLTRPRTIEPPASFVAPTFGQRFGGRVLDGLLLLPVYALSAVALSGTALGVVLLVMAAVYEVVGVSVWGQTLGKKVVGTRVVTFSSEPLRPWQAAIRFTTYALPAFVCTAAGLRLGGEGRTLIVLLPVLRPPLHRGVHDFAAGTIVTQVAAAG